MISISQSDLASVPKAPHPPSFMLSSLSTMSCCASSFTASSPCKYQPKVPWQLWSVKWGTAGVSLKGCWRALPVAHGVLSPLAVFETWTRLLADCTVQYSVGCGLLPFCNGSGRGCSSWYIYIYICSIFVANARGSRSRYDLVCVCVFFLVSLCIVCVRMFNTLDSWGKSFDVPRGRFLSVAIFFPLVFTFFPSSYFLEKYLQKTKKGDPFPYSVP